MATAQGWPSSGEAANIIAVTEDQLIEGCRRGDREAQRALYAQTSERIYRLVYRMTRNKDDAFDLVQDAYLRAFERIHQFDGSAALATWLYQIALTETLQFLRKRRQRDEGLHRNDWSIKGESVVESPDVRLDLQEAISRLSEVERALILLKYFEGLDYADIAQVLGKPEGTIASGLNRARRNLKEILKTEPDLHEENRPEEHPI